MLHSSEKIDAYNNNDSVRWSEFTEHPLVGFKVWKDILKPESIDGVVATSDLGANNLCASGMISVLNNTAHFYL